MLRKRAFMAGVQPEEPTKGETMVAIIRAMLTRLGAGKWGVPLLLASTLVSACAFGSPPESPSVLGATPEAPGSPSPEASPEAPLVVTPAVSPTPWATSASRRTATPRPALPTPGPTSTPAPSRQLSELTRSLDEKVAALAEALAARDVDRSLLSQRALLSEADRVETGLETDRSPQADLVRQAIRDLRGGATGDSSKLDSVRAKLRVASGQTGGPEGSGGQSLQAVAASLQSKLNSFNAARQQNQVDMALKLQGELLQEVSQAQKAVANQHSETADRLRGALEDLKSGLSGEDSKLESAASTLQALGAASSQSGGSSAASSTLLRDATGALEGKVSALQQALSGGSREQLLQAQRDLLEEVARAEAVAKGNNSDLAARLRDAASLARQGASGDQAKLDGARAKLAGAPSTAAGGATQPAQASQSGPPPDLQAEADDLSRKVDSYKAALDKGDRPAMLRLQQELIEQLSRNEQSLPRATGRQAEQMRSALSDLRNALAGDLSKLNAANASLRLVAAGPEPERPSPLPQQPASPPEGNQQTQAAARDLLSTANNVEAALQSGDADVLDRVQKELDQREKAIQKLPPEEAAALSSAVGAIREALGGDRAKLDLARSRLKEAIPR